MENGLASEEGRLVTAAYCAEYLSISLAMVYKLMENGTLPYVKIGRCRRVVLRELRALAEAGVPTTGRP